MARTLSVVGSPEVGADRKQGRPLGTQLGDYLDEATVVDTQPCPVRADPMTVRATPNRAENQVVDLRLIWRALPLKLHFNALRPGLGSHGAGPGHDPIESVGIKFLPDLDCITVRARHQTIEHFDHIDAGTKGGRLLYPSDPAEQLSRLE